MKTIGLIGGMSWESTVDYYRIINQEVARRHGGLHSAKILMYSVDFGELEPLMREGKWEEIGQHMATIAKTLESGGADVILLAPTPSTRLPDGSNGPSRFPSFTLPTPREKRLPERD